MAANTRKIVQPTQTFPQELLDDYMREAEEACDLYNAQVEAAKGAETVDQNGFVRTGHMVTRKADPNDMEVSPEEWIRLIDSITTESER